MVLRSVVCMRTYLVFAEQWKVENDLKWLGVRRENDQVGEAAIEGLCRLVGAFLQLYHLTKGDSKRKRCCVLWMLKEWLSSYISAPKCHQ